MTYLNKRFCSFNLPRLPWLWIKFRFAEMSSKDIFMTKMCSKDIIMTYVASNPSLMLPLIARHSPKGRAGARVVVLGQGRPRQPAQGRGGVVVVDPAVVSVVVSGVECCSFAGVDVGS